MNHLLEAKVSAVSVVSSKRAIGTGQTMGLSVGNGAEVVATLAAKVALQAGNGGLNRDTVANSQVLHSRTDRHHRGRWLVTEYVGSGEHKVSHCSVLPQVNVGTADAGRVRLEETFWLYKKMN